MTPITAFTIVDMLSLLVYLIIAAVLIFALIFAITAIVGLIRGVANMRRQQPRHRPAPEGLTEDEKKHY